jgi:hypothetical protein
MAGMVRDVPITQTSYLRFPENLKGKPFDTGIVPP